MKQPEQPEDFTPNEIELEYQLWLKHTLERGAEPYWMQDIRIASQAIQAERARLRAARSADSSE